MSVVALLKVTKSTLETNADATQALPGTTSGARQAVTSSTGQGASPALTRVDQLPFYRRYPIVPILDGLSPLPPFPSTKFPRLPSESFSTSTSKSWYFTTRGINPGLQRATWEEYRANMEAHLGLPEPYCPNYYRVSNKLPPQLAQIAVLPPPPRPQVQLSGPHFWVVYSGRAPGIYDNMYVLYSSNIIGRITAPFYLSILLVLWTFATRPDRLSLSHLYLEMMLRLKFAVYKARK